MKNIHGWTLIELLFTLTVVSILTVLGASTFNDSLKYHNEEIALKTLFHLSVYTRTEAIRRNNYYTLCPSDNQTQCGGVWNQSLIVFSDYNKNKKIDGADVLYRTFTFKPGTPCIKWKPSQRQFLQFKPSGASNGTAGHFSFCDTVNRTIQNKIVISFNGRISLKKL